MQANKRHGNRWTVNEVLSLQREYELLEWTVQQIAEKHQRSLNSIFFKLEQEGFINSWNDARGFDPSYFQEKNIMNAQDCDDESEGDEESCDNESDEDYVDEGYEDEDDDDDDDENHDNASEVTKLAERVWSLEATVSDISFMVKQMFDSMVNTTPKKRQLSSSPR